MKRMHKLLSTRIGALFGAAISIALAGSAHGQEAAPFTHELVKEQAQALASQAFKDAQEALPKGAENIDYDRYRQIRFQQDRTIWLKDKLNFQVQVLPLGWLYKVPIEINLVENDVSRPLSADNGFFDLGPLSGKLPPEARLGFSGFRILSPVNRPDMMDEVVVFQGASYFRAVSRGQVYGLSARGLALNVGQQGGEEFPAFRRFWIEKPKPGAERLVVHALLDSKSVTGAYRFDIAPGAPTQIGVSATLYPRKDLVNVGIAPLTSMFLLGDLNQYRVSDFRNAVHDSDGLAMVNGIGEHLWRPLNNPKRLQISHFLDQNPRGFGLLQRARQFEHYQDLEAGYERRPSAWVVPSSGWGAGAVELLELPTEEEIHDNVVSFWRPAQPLPAGRAHNFTYTLSWPDDTPLGLGRATVTASRSGLINGPLRKNGTIQFVVDFESPVRFGTDELPVAKLVASAGAVSATVVQRQPHIPNGLRVSFNFDPKGAALAEFRLQLAVNDKTVSESWLYRWTKE